MAWTVVFVVVVVLSGTLWFFSPWEFAKTGLDSVFLAAVDGVGSYWTVSFGLVGWLLVNLGLLIAPVVLLAVLAVLLKLKLIYTLYIVLWV